jgi:hypothetical protein
MPCSSRYLTISSRVLPEPLEQIDVEPALFPQPLAERLWPGRPQQEARFADDRERLDVLDDVLVPQLGQHLALVADPLGELLGVRDLRTYLKDMQSARRTDEVVTGWTDSPIP